MLSDWSLTKRWTIQKCVDYFLMIGYQLMRVQDWKERYQLSPPTGHNEDGETVCIHSLCIHPQFQGKGFGKILLRSYVQRIKDSGVAKRVSLICRQRYIPFYVKAGFTNVGPSKCQYGGGGWVDMVLEFEDGGVDDGQDGY